MFSTRTFASVLWRKKCWVLEITHLVNNQVLIEWKENSLYTINVSLSFRLSFSHLFHLHTHWWSNILIEWTDLDRKALREIISFRFNFSTMFFAPYQFIKESSFMNDMCFTKTIPRGAVNKEIFWIVIIALLYL